MIVFLSSLAFSATSVAQQLNLSGYSLTFDQDFTKSFFSIDVNADSILGAGGKKAYPVSYEEGEVKWTNGAGVSRESCC